MKRLRFLLTLLMAATLCHARLQVSQLTCEHLDVPLCVDVLNPRLSWILTEKNGEQGQYQTAYQIQVASSLKLLRQGKADLWDSGRVGSRQSTLVAYQGRQLRSNETCYWRVRVWDRHGLRTSWSEESKWHMGLLSADEWKAEWIGAPWENDLLGTAPADNINSQAPLFRKDINIVKPVKAAHIFICGLGYFELYVDAKKVGNDVLVPNQTDYSYRFNLERTRVAIENAFTGYRCLYLCYDLKQQLSKGAHALGVVLGNGFFNSGNAFAMPYGSPRLIAQLHIDYEDGTQDIVTTDPSWLVKPSAITMNGIYSGEIYDAGLYDASAVFPILRDEGVRGDNELGALGSDNSWQQAVSRRAPDGNLQAQMSPSDEVSQCLQPQSIKRNTEGNWVVDFGEEISGWVNLRNLKGKTGQKIEVKYLSESPNGTYTYIMKGDTAEHCRPHFTWFVFRSVEIKGLSQPLTAADIRAEAVNTHLAPSTFFECSDTLLNKIHHIWQRTLLDNAHGSLLSDCPHRERSGYLGDGQVACDMVMQTFDARGLYNKWIADMRLAQNPETGFVPFGAPWQPGCGGGVPWSAGMIIIPYTFYENYGDTLVLARQRPAMQRLMDYFAQWVDDEGIMEQKREIAGGMSYWGNLGEWCTPTDTMPSQALVHTFYYWLCAKQLSEICRLTNQASDAARYAALAARTSQAFHRRFYDPHTQSYGPAGSNAFALEMGVPADREAAVVKTLLRQLKEHGGHIFTGIYGTKYLFEVLGKYGYTAQAYEALTKTDYPGFGHWIAQGATTTWEQWDGANSHNHPMFGACLTWLYNSLAGVRLLQDGTSLRFDIAPQLPEGVSWVNYIRQTTHGVVAVSWKRIGDRLTGSVDIPVGCTAQVRLPGRPAVALTAGHYEF